MSTSAAKSVAASLPGTSRRKLGQFEFKVWSPGGSRIEVKSTRNHTADDFDASFLWAWRIVRPFVDGCCGRQNAFAGIFDKSGDLRDDNQSV